MRNFVLAFIMLAALSIGASAGNTVTPTTTLAIETGNNTSTANIFKTQSNGNPGAANISKEPIRSLLYAGATTKIYVHLMGWFGGTNHMNVGYTSNDAAQVARQVDDMMSRGIDGAILDWYGQYNTRPEQVAQFLRVESEKRNGKFKFAITEDSGALKTCAKTAGCDLSNQVIKDLTYAYQQYETSPAYIYENGRPVVFFFGMDAYTLDWTRIRAGVPGNPLFIFRNSGAFSNPYSNGGFGWVGISSTNQNSMGLGYLDNFYSVALRYPTKFTYGSAYPGFNDTLASWGANRIVNRQCGQTWLATMAEAGKYYSTSKQLANTQLVTWNDYEEGSELESGVDNCVKVSASVTGDQLTWVISGQENTVDHYTVFISSDGQNLMRVANVAVGTHQLDLSQNDFEPASYTIYVKAVGKASIRNQMSPAVSYLVSNQPPVAKLVVSPSSGIGSVTASASTATSTDSDGKIVASSIDFGDGTVVSGTTATHTYSTPGVFTVKATVTDDDGATDSATATVTVFANQPPQARLSVSPGSGTAPVTVSASTLDSTDADGRIVSSSIDFGDGTLINSATASHTYSNPGTYTVTAKVTDDLGASSTATAKVTVTAPAPVNQAPVAKLSLSATAAIAPATITASTSASTDSDGSIASSVINWGDGTSSTGTTASHAYAKEGTYTVSATVTDNMGAKSTIASTVKVTCGVNIISPLNNATTPSSVHVVATASSTVAITAIRIYVDYVSVYLVNNTSRLDTYVTLTKGTHRVVVQSWDSAGVVSKSTVFVTVQ